MDDALEGSLEGRIEQLSTIYGHLDATQYQIRILATSSQKTDDIVAYELKTISLINPPDYATLSYCWGDPNDTSDILVNGLTTPVTSNLASALRRLRQLGVTNVWADAICINQADRLEKGHQIRYMTHIYTRAQTTYAWIGDGKTVDGDRAMRFLQTVLLERTILGDIPHSLCPSSTVPSTQTQSLSKENTTVPAIHQLPDFDFVSRHGSCKRCRIESDFQQLLQFFRRSYWRRRWIIQEIAASFQVQVISDDERMNFNDMVIALDLCRKSRYWLPEMGADYAFIAGIVQFREQFQGNQKPLICDAIKRSRNSVSRDRADKLFALLGISLDGVDLVPESAYQQPIEVVVMNLTRALIAKTGCLDFILINSTGTGNELGLPSWAPDWLSGRLPAQAYALAQKPRTDHPLALPLSSDSTQLQIPGICLGSISNVTSILDPSVILNQKSEEPVTELQFTTEATKRKYYQYGNRDGLDAILDCLLEACKISHNDTPNFTPWPTMHGRTAILDSFSEARHYLESVSASTTHVNSSTYSVEGLFSQWMTANASFPVENKYLKDWLTQSPAFGVMLRLFKFFLCTSVGYDLILISLCCLFAIPSAMLIKSRSSGSVSGAIALFIIFTLLFWTALWQLPRLSRHIADLYKYEKYFRDRLPDTVGCSMRVMGSREGFIGMVPASARSGDIVCHLLGSEHTFVLRGVPKMNGQSEQEYTIVGKASVVLNQPHQNRYRWVFEKDAQAEFKRRRDQPGVQQFVLV